MHYQARIIKSEGIHIVSFPDFPGISTYGDTLKEAKDNAAEALNSALVSEPTLPDPQKAAGRYYYPVRVDPNIEIAFALRKLRGERSQGSIARMLDISYQAYQKLENPRTCNPTVKSLEKVAAVMGKELRLSFN